MRAIFRNIKTLLFFPLAVIPIGMLFYGIGTMLVTPTLIGTPIFENELKYIPEILKDMGMLLQSQLGLLAAITISLGLSRKSIVSVIITVFTYFFMQVVFNTLSQIILPKDLLVEIDKLPMTIYPFQLVGGVIIGAIIARYNIIIETKTSAGEEMKNRIKSVILGAFLGMIAAIILAVIWVYLVQFLIILNPYFSGIVGSGLYGFLSALLKPFGLTILFDTLKNYTFVGGVWHAPSPINTNLYGYEAIWLAQLQYANAKFTVGTQTAVNYINAIFVVPAIALAIIRTSFVEHRKNVKLVLTVFIVASMLIGFTLPIELTLFLTSPLLFLFNAITNSILSVVVHILSQIVTIKLITVTGGGLIDLLFYGVLPGVENTGAWILILVGLIAGVINYYAYYFAIKMIGIKTFGRSKDEADMLGLYFGNKAEEGISGVTAESKIDLIIKALGGYKNIEKVYASMYRLHVVVKNVEQVDQLTIKKNGAAGVFIVQATVQIIFGAITNEYFNILTDKIDASKK
ncbi:MAG: glucose PTS transporter subunit EIIB [Culicoidibacterales bacterium]